MRPLVPLAALLVLAACAESSPPDPTPTDDAGAYNLIDPVDLAMADEGAPAIGEWTRSIQDERPALLFGPTGAEPLFSLSCDDREGVLLSRHGVVETGSAGMMTLVLGSENLQLAANPVQAPLPLLQAAVPANDPLLTRLGDYGGPLRVVVGEGPALVLPASPMIGDFIEACAGGNMALIDTDAGTDDAADVTSNTVAPAAEPPANASATDPDA
jgi:hypothetical protein